MYFSETVTVSDQTRRSRNGKSGKSKEYRLRSPYTPAVILIYGELLFRSLRTFEVTVSRGDIARRVGGHPATVSRGLVTLAEQGVISKVGKRFEWDVATYKLLPQPWWKKK